MKFSAKAGIFAPPAAAVPPLPPLPPQPAAASADATSAAAIRTFLIRVPSSVEVRSSAPGADGRPARRGVYQRALPL